MNFRIKSFLHCSYFTDRVEA